jgi:hypothetical protein
MIDFEKYLKESSPFIPQANVQHGYVVFKRQIFYVPRAVASSFKIKDVQSAQFLFNDTERAIVVRLFDEPVGEVENSIPALRSSVETTYFAKVFEYHFNLGPYFNFFNLENDTTIHCSFVMKDRCMIVNFANPIYSAAVAREKRQDRALKKEERLTGETPDKKAAKIQKSGKRGVDPQKNESLP